MWISEADVDRWFTHHPPTPEQVADLVAIRAKARELAHLIRTRTPACADQSAAIRLVRESVMTANAAIVCVKPKTLDD